VRADVIVLDAGGSISLLTTMPSPARWRPSRYVASIARIEAPPNPSTIVTSRAI
jgi:hypothetical protein